MSLYELHVRHILTSFANIQYARGTTQAGNVGAPDVEGPTFFNALASAVGGESRLAIQGVTYPANVFGFLAGGTCFQDLF
jgi:hypothetical protein